MEPYMLFILVAVGVVAFIYWHQRKSSRPVQEPPDEGFTIATDIVDREFAEKTEDIDQALSASEAESELANILNRRRGPL